MFVGNPILGNVQLHRKEFHQESYYDVPALMDDPRFRDSMRLIEHYSLFPFMRPRQYYYPRVVLQFYHSMTSRGAAGPLELRFSIDDRPGVLRAADISATLGCIYRRPIQRVIELGPTHLSGRWFAYWPETSQLGQYSSGGSSRLRCCWSITSSGPAYSLYIIMYSGGGPSWRLFTGYQRDTGLVPLSW